MFNICPLSKKKHLPGGVCPGEASRDYDYLSAALGESRAERSQEPVDPWKNTIRRVETSACLRRVCTNVLCIPIAPNFLPQSRAINY
jgi:hypothetical protein